MNALGARLVPGELFCILGAVRFGRNLRPLYRQRRNVKEVTDFFGNYSGTVQELRLKVRRSSVISGSCRRNTGFVPEKIMEALIFLFPDSGAFLQRELPRAAASEKIGHAPEDCPGKANSGT